MEDEVVPVDWSLPEIADALRRGVQARSEADRQAQAVRGLDSLSELQFHAVIDAILRESGYAVHREQRYPIARGRRRRSEGERCDFVLCPADRPLVEEESVSTLFAADRSTEPSQALWLEVKVVSQFLEEGANASYASALQQPVRRDVAKLARAEEISHAAVLLVLFTAGTETARHDIEVWQSRCAERGLPVQSPYLRHVEMVDRLGNSCCTIALFRIKGW